MNRANVLAVEVDGGAVVERDHGQSLFRGRFYSITRHLTAFLQALADIFMSDDGRFSTEFHISARVVSMKMRVEHEFDGLVCDRLQCLFNLWGQRRKLVIHQHDAILTNRDSDVSS